MKEQIGRRVKQAREYRGITQEILAEKVGLSWSAISRLETGNSMVGVATLLRISQALEVGIESLLCDFTQKDKNDFLTSEIEKEIMDLSQEDKEYILEMIKLAKKHYLKRNK